jgi:hypothetical protein
LAIHSGARADAGEIEVLYSIKAKFDEQFPRHRQCIQLLPARLTEKPKLHYLLRIIYFFPSCLWRGSQSVLQSQSCCIGELHSGLLPTKASCRVHRRFNYLLLYCTVRQEEVKSENCMFGSWSVTSIRLDRCIAPALHAGSSCSSHRFRNPPHFDRGVRVLCQASLCNSLDRSDHKTEILLANEVA